MSLDLCRTTEQTEKSEVGRDGWAAGRGKGRNRKLEQIPAGGQGGKQRDVGHSRLNQLAAPWVVTEGDGRAGCLTFHLEM